MLRKFHSKKLMTRHTADIRHSTAWYALDCALLGDSHGAPKPNSWLSGNCRNSKLNNNELVEHYYQVRRRHRIHPIVVAMKAVELLREHDDAENPSFSLRQLPYNS